MNETLQKNLKELKDLIVEEKGGYILVNHNLADARFTVIWEKRVYPDATLEFHYTYNEDDLMEYQPATLAQVFISMIKAACKEHA